MLGAVVGVPVSFVVSGLAWVPAFVPSSGASAATSVVCVSVEVPPLIPVSCLVLRCWPILAWFPLGLFCRDMLFRLLDQNIFFSKISITQLPKLEFFKTLRALYPILTITAP